MSITKLMALVPISNLILVSKRIPGVEFYFCGVVACKGITGHLHALQREVTTVSGP